ncbi:hypothetical protein P4661_27400 [Priestia megaterium]|uniref:hypothetical protein n=1 Tax=Priestia megaterium TaxID=1404 RepID=UPI002E20533F|nr:hypothetical protein [Priestia megaterium]
MSGFTPNPQNSVLNWMSSNAFVQVNKSLLRKIGDRNTILLSETIRQYQRWAPNKLQADGSFYWTQVNCEIETGYSRSTQQRGFKDLEQLNLLKSRGSKIVENGIEKQVRFITLDFLAIEKLMFEDDSHLIEAIIAKYETKKQQNRASKIRVKEEAEKAKKEGIQNESSLEPQGIELGGIQNESSGGFKMNPTGDSKRVVSKKESLIKNNNSLKNNSITHRELDAVNLPSELKECISSLVDRLNDNNITVLEIFDIYKAYEGNEQVTDGLFIKEFRKAVSGNESITSLDALLTTYLTNAVARQTPKQANVTPIRSELIPEWFKQQEESKAAAAPKEDVNADFEEQARKMKEELMQLGGKSVLTN